MFYPPRVKYIFTSVDPAGGGSSNFAICSVALMQTGQLMTRLSSDVDLVKSFTSHGLALLLRAMLMLVGSVVMMFVINAQLALLTLIVLPLASLLIWGLMNLARPLFMVVQEKLSALNTSVQENLAGVQVVKAFVRERFEIDRFETNNTDFMRENIRVGRLLAVALPILTLLTDLGIVGVEATEPGQRIGDVANVIGGSFGVLQQRQ